MNRLEQAIENAELYGFPSYGRARKNKYHMWYLEEESAFISRIEKAVTERLIQELTAEANARCEQLPIVKK